MGTNQTYLPQSVQEQHLMDDSRKTREQLISELNEARQLVADLERAERRRHQIEEELHETTSFLQSILDSSSSISIMWTDLDRTIRYWNTGAENIFGYTADEVIGRCKVDILYADDESRRVMSDVREELFRRKPVGLFKRRNDIQVDIPEKTRDGRRVWINMTLIPRYDDKGDVMGILGIGQDITDRKRAEADLQTAMGRLRNVVSGIIEAMSKTMESRDPYTAGHQHRVAKLADAIARELRLSDDLVEGVVMAASIHDLGKIAVPAEILSSPARLTEIHMDIIRTHPKVGYEILKNIDFPWPVADMVRQHHEKLDGSGYPDGLCDDEIMLESRIIAVADVVEAMASHRPYRASLGLELALKEITDKRGTQFDEDVVDACLTLIHSKRFEFERDANGNFV